LPIPAKPAPPQLQVRFMWASCWKHL
jgi:hypothetical protein